MHRSAARLALKTEDTNEAVAFVRYSRNAWKTKGHNLFYNRKRATEVLKDDKLKELQKERHVGIARVLWY